MDGDLKFWNALEKVMTGITYIGILDIIHVVEYLWGAANALFGERSENGKKWVYDQLGTGLIPFCKSQKPQYFVF